MADNLDYAIEDQGRLEWVVDNRAVFRIGAGSLDLFTHLPAGGLKHVLFREDHDYRAAIDDARKKQEAEPCGKS